MAAAFNGVVISTLDDSGRLQQKSNSPFSLSFTQSPASLTLNFKSDDDGSSSVIEISQTDYARVGHLGYILTQNNETVFLKFQHNNDANQFHSIVSRFKTGKNSVFEARTDETSAVQYFQFYGYLSQQQNMMQDFIRTSTYQQAMLSNIDDFKNKVVLDVGAGSGILSFFAIQAGAKTVYAVEASTMAVHAESLVNNNKLAGKVVVIPGKIEEIKIPEPVDVIISEPMGYMLFNERMLETYLHAKKWLRPSGKMFPSKGDLHIAPFSDETLYTEQCQKTNFWYQESFHGVDLSSLRHAAIKEYFKQPIVDTFDIRICLAKSQKYTVDFLSTAESDLHVIDIPLQFELFRSGIIHGLAFWFDVAFIGQNQTIWLSTAPTEPLTHWYQVRCLLETPVFAKQGQIITGRAFLKANKKQSYDVEIEVSLGETGTTSKNTLDLKNPFFRYTGQPPQAPPGCNTSSPSENYWLQIDQQNAVNQCTNYANGLIENGMVNGMNDPNMQQSQHHSLYQTGNVIQNSNLVALGSIPSTGQQGQQQSQQSQQQQQQRVPPCMPALNVPTSSIGGGISPSVFSQQQHAVVMGNTSHYPVNNSLMIGDYVTPGNIMLPGQCSPLSGSQGQGQGQTSYQQH